MVHFTSEFPEPQTSDPATQAPPRTCPGNRWKNVALPLQPMTNKTAGSDPGAYVEGGRDELPGYRELFFLKTIFKSSCRVKQNGGEGIEFFFLDPPLHMHRFLRRERPHQMGHSGC